ncbi:MAG: hypothetical protein B7Z81_01585 [Acidocella sp. 20-61-6]|nr:MAG: hypothetical protein B7Z81_01585 [Acidocella sp. 20-61-6]
MDALQYALGGGSGVLVGFTLGLVGGGGSVLAVPLIVYLVGVKNPHIAIGTSAFAVAVNAGLGLLQHARVHNVNWRCGGLYAVAGVFGALLGSSVGKAFNGQKLLFLFALVMLAVGVVMLRRRGDAGHANVLCSIDRMPKVSGFGFVTGLFAGFFGIGGGFLIVPGLVASTGMSILTAVGTSLVAVTAFGLTTAVNYAFSGLINWPLALVFILGGMVGSFIGSKAARRLADTRGLLNTVFSVLIFVVAFYMLYRSVLVWG